MTARRARKRTWTAVALGTLLLAGALATIPLWKAPPPVSAQHSTAIRSIAVLPLRNLTGDVDQNYFADGMTEALITDLSRIGSLKVIARATSMRYKQTDKPPGAIARELDVDALVDGSVLREGNRVAISVQLIEAATEQNRWAERYERDLTSVLTLQGEVAQAIAREIHVTLTPEEQRLLGRERPVDPAAYEAYLQGRFHRDRFTPEDLQIALQYFESAIEIDSRSAHAYVGISSVWAFRMTLGVTPPLEAGPRAVEAAVHALELDNSLAEAHQALAGMRAWFEWDWAGAEAEFRRALELNPSYAEARVFYSHFLTMLGREEEGTQQMQRALELDPLNPFFQAMSGVQRMMSRDVDGALAQLHRAEEMAPGFGFAHQPLWRVLHYLGRFDGQAALRQRGRAGRRAGPGARERRRRLPAGHAPGSGGLDRQLTHRAGPSDQCRQPVRRRRRP